ncbi:hypothetical protein SDC9_42166 [bioreactor metagenome]|uniref:Uncharacterized protein n=1 Tax=bioreactor metagenome TaxID=1076179 RepID=A0A644VX52_9ZZZZ
MVAGRLLEGKVQLPQVRKRQNNGHRGQHVDDREYLDIAHAQARGHKDDAAAGGKVVEHGRGHERGNGGGPHVDERQNNKLRHGDKAYGKAHEGAENHAREHVQRGLGQQDVGLAGEAFMKGPQKAHAAKAECRHQGYDHQGKIFVAHALALKQAKNGPQELLQQGLSIHDFAHHGAENKRNRHGGQCCGLTHKACAQTQGYDAKDGRQRLFEPFRKNVGKNNADDAADEKSATVHNWPDHMRAPRNGIEIVLEGGQEKWSVGRCESMW